jgi:hypothetical protein
LRVAKDSFVSGTAYFNNITVYGTSSIQYITSSQVNIGSNIITVNTDTPAIRFGGLSVFDSGSTQLTGSLFWDSEKNNWIYSNPSGSTYNSGMIISGPRNSGSLGSEEGTTFNALMKGQGGDHITSSQMFDDGTTVRIPGNLQVTGSAIVTSNLRTDTGLGIKYGSFVSTSGYLNLFSALAGSTATLNLKDGTGGFETALNFPVSANRSYTFPNADGTVALTSNLSAYLPLAGGTLTGPLTGSSATFSANVSIGTTTPGTKLQVIDDGNTFSAHFSANALTNGIAFGTLTGNYASIQGYTKTFSAINSIYLQPSGGNVGIGVPPYSTFPDSKLHVFGTRSNTVNAANAIAKIGGSDVYISFGALNGTPNYGTWIQALRPSDDASFPISLQSVGGNVLIGTTTDSSYKLDVNGTGRFSDQLIVKTNASAQGISIWGRSDDFAVLRFKTSDGATTKATIYTNPSDLIFETAGTTRLTIASTGAATFASSVQANSIKLNTATSNGYFHIETSLPWGTKSNDLVNFTGYGYDGNIYTEHNYGSINWFSGAVKGASITAWRNVPADGDLFDLTFSTNPGGSNITERMRITSGGYVGINTTPGDRFSVLGGNNIWTGKFSGTTTVGQSYGIDIIAGSNSSDASMLVRNYLGTDYFRIRGDGLIAFPKINDFTTGNSPNTWINPASSYGIYINTSSIRYKKDVINYDKGIDIVNQLRPVYYKGKSDIDGDKQFAGFIAEEIHDLGLEEFVQYNEDGLPNSLAYPNMITLAIKAIQELKAEINELKNK